MTQEKNSHIQHNHKNSNNNNDSKKMVIGSSVEIVDMMASEKDKEEKLIEPGSHNLLIYNDLKAFRRIYGNYVSSLLSQNEIIVIATQYDTIDEVKNTLRLAGIDVESYLNQGSLFILDAQREYQVDTYGMWKLAMSLLSRAKKEDRRGVTWFGDPGSFFSFEKIEELMQYELWCPHKYEDEKMKTVCCYHLENFRNLNKNQQQTLFDHHFKSIVVE